MFAALPPEQRVALIGHEVAHARNGDSRRGLVVGSAWAALEALYRILAPDPYAEGPDVFMNGAYWLVSRPVYGLLLLHARLTAHDAQRAEYLADALAADVAGTDAVVGLLETILLEGVVRSVVKRSTHSGAVAPGSLLSEVERSVMAVPDRERQRRRRVARLERPSLDAFHPTMSSRIAVLESRALVLSSLAITQAESDAIDEELAPLRAPLELRMIDEYRSTIYA